MSTIARVVEEHKTKYILRTETAEYTAVIRGKVLTSTDHYDFPKVGDYVEYSETGDGKAVIESIVPRKSQLVRKVAGGDTAQVIVANVDMLLIVMGLDLDFNIRRLERYLLLAEQSSIPASIVLNKADMVESTEQYVAEVRTVAGTTPIYVVNALSGNGLQEVRASITATTTAVLLGSSGAGKSTITNWLLQHSTQETQPVRADDGRGRHTTTHRSLFALPGGGYLIDTPGMRELGLYTTEENHSELFIQIESLMEQCKYSNCDHDKTDGCAVQAAIAAGVLDKKQFENYKKIKKEQEQLQEKFSRETYKERKDKVKKRQQEYKKSHRNKYGDNS